VPLQLAPFEFAASHALPQPAQFVVVVVAVSQPFRFGGVMLQSAKPALQLEYMQAEPLQVGPFELVASHGMPQPPQSAVVLVVLVSQPLLGFESQSPNPELHDGAHPPVEPLKVQLIPPFAFMHEVAQFPQCIGIVRSTRQPLCGLPAHTACVGSQIGWQIPPEQLVLVVPVSMQALPQPPQFAVEVLVLVSQPLSGLKSQSEKLAGLQLGTQPPIEPSKVHDVVPCALVQAVPHAPQWLVVVRSVSQPLLGFESQSACVELHTGLQTLATQLLVPPAAVHTMPHAPQLLASLVVSTHEPEPNEPPLQ